MPPRAFKEFAPSARKSSPQTVPIFKADAKQSDARFSRYNEAFSVVRRSPAVARAVAVSPVFETNPENHCGSLFRVVTCTQYSTGTLGTPGALVSVPPATWTV